MGFKWDNVDKVTREGGRNKGGYRLFINDGDTVAIRFIPGENEPFIMKRHYDNRSNRYIVCAEDLAIAGKHEGCVACAVARSEGKNGRMKNAQRVFMFSVYDPRKVHVIGEGKEREYIPCSDDESKCKYCRKGNEARVNGVRYWAMSEKMTNALRQFEHDLVGKKCAKCQLGKIKVEEYQCPDCGNELDVDDPHTEYKCFPCTKKNGRTHMVEPKEIITCSKGCAKPRRTTLADCWVEVTRTGNKQDTVYNYSVGEIEPLSDELKKLESIDFAKHPDFAVLPSGEVAAILQVPNPFRPLERRDEEDEAPKKKRGLLSRADDDDDDDVNSLFTRGKKKQQDDDDEDDD